MRKLAMTAVAALLVATPVLAQSANGSDEPQSAIEWQNLVAKANANRFAGAGGDVAAAHGMMATDASPAPAPATTNTQPVSGRYQRIDDYRQDR